MTYTNFGILFSLYLVFLSVASESGETNQIITIKTPGRLQRSFLARRCPGPPYYAPPKGCYHTVDMVPGLCGLDIYICDDDCSANPCKGRDVCEPCPFGLCTGSVCCPPLRPNAPVQHGCYNVIVVGPSGCKQLMQECYCKKDFQQYSECVFPGSEATCENPYPEPLTTRHKRAIRKHRPIYRGDIGHAYPCQPGCSCEYGMVLHNGECINRYECPTVAIQSTNRPIATAATGQLITRPTTATFPPIPPNKNSGTPRPTSENPTWTDEPEE